MKVLFLSCVASGERGELAKADGTRRPIRLPGSMPDRAVVSLARRTDPCLAARPKTGEVSKIEPAHYFRQGFGRVHEAHQ